MRTFMMLVAFFLMQISVSNAAESVINKDNPFLGMWTIMIEDGSVGWLNVHEKEGYLDAELLWKGGSVIPVSHVYMLDDDNLIVTRTYDIDKGKEETGRKHTITAALKVKRSSEGISGVMTAPNRNGIGEMEESFKGWLLPIPTDKPDLSKIKYSAPINLFNGKDLSGWKITNPKQTNGYQVINGELVNQPVQEEGGDYISYGNLRTEQEFQDFNLKLEVNVPEGNNSGVYLRGMYEVQVNDSYGKELDSHHMGALYSRITPVVAAEKPGGEWQTMDITLCQRHVTIVLNGQKIIDNKPIYGPTGGAIKADVYASGPIFLQGDHGEVRYRNIVLTPIE